MVLPIIIHHPEAMCPGVKAPDDDERVANFLSFAIGLFGVVNCHIIVHIQVVAEQCIERF